MENKFLYFSKVLTGIEFITNDLAIECENRIRSNGVHEAKLLDELLDKFSTIAASPNSFEQEITLQIMTEPRLRKLVTSIIFIYYTGELLGNTEIQAKHWFQAKLWKVIHAHIPGLSGNYFGHWSYPPDN